MPNKKAYLDPMVIPPKSSTQHTHTLILLHGRGSNALSFGSELLASTKLPSRLPTVKLIFPTAKKRRAIALGRLPINQWFDITSLEDPDERADIQIEGLCETGSFLRELIEREAAVFAGEPDGGYGRIILGGLSQGCATGIFTFLAGQDDKMRKLGGFAGMSGWLPLNGQLEQIFESAGLSLEDDDPFSKDGEEDPSPRLQAISHIRDILDLHPLPTTPAPSDMGTAHLQAPVFLGHGSEDEKVSVKLGENIVGFLERLEMDVTWKVYEGFGHWYKVPDEIDDIVRFLDDKVGVPVSD